MDKVDYNNGKIYLIRNHCNDMVYVGSTTQSLSKRFSRHKASMKCKKYQLYEAFEELGIENFYIELLENYKCSCKDELHKREGEYIRKFDSYKNGLNMVIAGRPRRESSKEYYEKNKEKVNEKYKVYYEANKDTINHQRKHYYEVNKEKMKQKFSCECGSIITHRCKTRHFKTKKHLNFIKDKPNKNI